MKYSESSVVESSEKSTEASHSSKKYCIINSKCNHSTDNCKDLLAMVNKHEQKERKFQELWKEQQRANALFDKKFRSL